MARGLAPNKEIPMITRHSRGVKRSAFTLVELMIVVIIIAVLVSLVSAAIAKVMDKIPEVQTSTDIAQLGVALQAFMSDYKLTDPPPSTLVLYETNPLQGPSAGFLQKAFGKNLGSFVDWNGDGQANGPWTLEGEQCLVFYVGGIGGTQGFSYNPTNPAAPGGSKRHGPYFTFQTNRLVPLNPTINATASPFPVYMDAWQVKNRPYGLKPGHPQGWPYAYFSSNGYNNTGYTQGALGALKDCQSIGATPYFTTTGQYINPNTYQIISAGKDGQFGTGNMATASSERPGGYDDQSSFSSTILGAGQN